MRWLLLSLAALAVSLGVTAFLMIGSGGDGVDPSFEVDVSHVRITPGPVELRGTPVFEDALAHEAAELRRVAEEHSRLLTSIPPTAEPTSAPSAAVVIGGGGTPQAVTAVEAREGVALATDHSSWFSPEEGIAFYRPEGGDWTPPQVREAHPYADFFYYESYPEEVPSFADGSIYAGLARELAFAAQEVAPFLGSPTADLVRSFRRNLGWELAAGELPYVQVWSTFRYSGGVRSGVYAVGGVLLMEVVSAPDGSGGEVQYLAPGSFAGPVVVERLRS